MSLRDELHAIDPNKARAAAKAEHETSLGMRVDELGNQIVDRITGYRGLSMIDDTIIDGLRAAGHSEEYIAGAEISAFLIRSTLISIAEVGEMPSLD